MWKEEEYSLFHAFVPQLIHAKTPRILSGCYHPENHNGSIERWTSKRFSILLPSRSAALMMRCHSPLNKEIIVKVGSLTAKGEARTIARYPVSSSTPLSFLLPETLRTEPVLLIFECDEHTVDNDHRPLGVLLTSVSVFLEESVLSSKSTLSPLREHAVDLSEELDKVLRSRYPELWIDALCAIASARSENSERAFASIRGPHSTALLQWLTDEGNKYDVVLVQGIPFDVVPSAVATLRKSGSTPRIVVLPHFHGDDRFYYWRRYLQAFRSADATLLFSGFVADRLGLPGATVVPGGGVDPAEFFDREARSAFMAVYQRTEPFFLVLGRKTASKGYARILTAYAELRLRGESPDLLLIGPDEDGVVIDQTGVHYIGSASRKIVLGALQACVSLVAMSESEGFGIVICEAWSAGKPVIANAECLAFRDLIRHGENGILVSTKEELVEAMWRLAQDSAYGMRLAAKGAAEAKRYSWDRVANEVLATLAPPPS